MAEYFVMMVLFVTMVTITVVLIDSLYLVYLLDQRSIIRLSKFMVVLIFFHTVYTLYFHTFSVG